MCDCGCGTCDTKSKLTLNENLAPKEILSEGLKFHLDNNRPLTENVYRAGSEEYFNVWSEARSLYSRGIINLTEDDKEILTETNLGEFGIVEGMKVPLDFPMEDEVKKEIKEDITPQEIEYYALHSDLLSNLSKALDDKDFHEKYMVLKTLLKDRPKRLKALDYFFNVLSPSKEKEELPVAEAKDKKSNKKLNKPMRDSSGGKAYKVYVKDPKTGNIKTVRFGSGGLKAKINNKKARTAFAKRHNCANKKDKTKAGYWSCRLPRYAKLLGLKSSFSGFW
jgi:hypothetical protein